MIQPAYCPHGNAFNIGGHTRASYRFYAGKAWDDLKSAGSGFALTGRVTALDERAGVSSVGPHTVKKLISTTIQSGDRVDIESVKRSYEEQVMRLPNVTGIGLGQKGGKDVIKVFVTRKVPESALKPDEIIPKVLEGYETDVEEIGIVSAQDL